MHRRASASVQDVDLCVRLFGPMRAGNVEMSSRKLRKPMHQNKDHSNQKPVGIIENEGKATEKWRRQERQERDGENEERDRHNHQIGNQGNRRYEMKIPNNKRKRTKPGRK